MTFEPPDHLLSKNHVELIFSIDGGRHLDKLKMKQQLRNIALTLGGDKMAKRKKAAKKATKKKATKKASRKKK